MVFGIGAGKIEITIDAVKFLGGTTTRIEWSIEAALDMPKAFDIRKKVQINVTT